MSGSVSSLNTWRGAVGWGGMLTKSKLSAPLCEMLAVETCESESAYPSSKTNQFQRRSACFEKKERKNLSTCLQEVTPKPTRDENFARFSRKKMAQFGLLNVDSALAKMGISRKRCFYEHGFRPAGMFIFSCGWLYGHLPVALAPVGSVPSVKCHKKRPFLLPSWPHNGWSTLLGKVNFGSVGYSWNQPEWVAWDSIIFDRARHCAKCADCTEWFF